MKRVSYTAEFKAEAVKQVIERGHGVVEVSDRLGVSDKNLYPLECVQQGQGHLLKRRRLSSRTEPVPDPIRESGIHAACSTARARAAWIAGQARNDNFGRHHRPCG